MQTQNIITPDSFTVDQRDTYVTLVVSGENEQGARVETAIRLPRAVHVRTLALCAEQGFTILEGQEMRFQRVLDILREANEAKEVQGHGA